MALETGEAAGMLGSDDMLLSIRGLCKSFKDMVAVEDLDLDIRRGEFFTMLGPSGSGKTTTLRLIAGFERADQGTILLDGQDMDRRAPFERDVNTVFQDYALFPHMSVAENIAYGLEAKALPKHEIATRVEEVLRMVRLESFAARKPGQLSGGQRQRVGLARAIVNRPCLLLLDEPLGALDLKLRQDMQMELKQIQQSLGITFLYVTHDQEEALSMSDRVAVFNEGRIEQVAPPHDLYEHPETEFVAAFVGTSSILERDGQRWVLRPEKLHLSLRAEDFDTPGWQTEKGVLQDSVYAGIFTRHIIRLERGETVVAVEQNTRRHVANGWRGAEIWVGWHEQEVFALKP